METKQAAPRSLLELPDACLLAVLQCLAADHASLSGWARAALTHSRLHQAAVAACSRIFRAVLEWELDSLLLYLDRHGGHVSSLGLADCHTVDIMHEESSLCRGHTSCAAIRQLPTSLVQLTSLQLEGFGLQLQPGGGFQGVVRCEFPLKQLRLNSCTLLDGKEGLAAALPLLPGLEHLRYCIDLNCVGDRPTARFSPQVLPQLQRLTYLELECELVPPEDPTRGQHALQPLQAVSRLVDLRLELSDDSITADMLSGSPHLTRLDLFSVGSLEPGALAGKTDMQHLYAAGFTIGGTAGSAQLLSHVQHMLQLTHLDLGCCLVADEREPPAAAFSALTASSKLQDLRFSHCIPPAGVWQHVFPAGRQLPHLTSLQIDDMTLPESDEPAAAPEGSRLVSCCPGLQFLGLEGVRCSAAHLAELQGLLALRTLLALLALRTLHVEYDIAEVQAVGLLTQLRELQLRVRDTDQGQLEQEGLLLHLAGLKQLTLLELSGPLTGLGETTVLQSKGPDDEPVWWQLLQLEYRDPDLAQQAAAALAGWG